MTFPFVLSEGKSRCTRPLGIRHDSKNNRLLIADAYLGVYAVDLANGAPQRIFPFPGDDFKVSFFDDLELLPDGRIAVTDASSKFQSHQFAEDYLEGRPNGR